MDAQEAGIWGIHLLLLSGCGNKLNAWRPSKFSSAALAHYSLPLIKDT